MPQTELGKLKGVYGVSPAFLQRAAAVALLSFVFFLLMMFGFYLRQNIGYFLLATAFLVINVLTLIGWLAIRRKTVQIYENGLSFKGQRVLWDEIEKVEMRSDGKTATGERRAAVIHKKDGSRFELPSAMDRVDQIVSVIRRKTNG